MTRRPCTNTEPTRLADALREIERLRAEVEALRKHHKLAVDQWTLEGQRVKELEGLLQQSVYHCESEGDDTLVLLINAALRGEGK